MSSNSFYCMTPAETHLKLKGYQNRRWESWQQARLISYNIYLSIPKKAGTATKSIEDYYPLPSDEKHKNNLTQKKMSDVWEKLKDR